MSTDREVLTVRILDKDYTVSCLPEERESLIGAASELNKRMKEMRTGKRTLGAERIAVITALNVIHEREQAKSSRLDALISAQEAVRKLESKLDVAIGRRDTA